MTSVIPETSTTTSDPRAQSTDKPRQPGTCADWPGICTEAESGHFDHSNHGHQVVDKSGVQLLDVGFAALSNDSNPRPVIYIGSEDWAPDEFHAASAAVRQLMDTGDDMAERTMLRQGNGEAALARIDQKIKGERTRMIAMVAHQRRVRIELRPSRTPFTESDTEQTASAAFSLACDAVGIALAKSPDKAGMVRALRAMVDLYADEASA
ncbi:hypothetical protein OG302_22435 [Streptomyces sp. NBC_01283]|uniref:hypothetical protein n=1 Tax=Streptomyces sp. NBC_01283 TaxID=2903812 RepID=UPI00352C54DF|nr:hypothetical protein OG302_22435 [Streptomyces sp. NBC_01283]